MSAERPDMNDDLDQAYTQAHALTDDGRGPAAAVRANVLAAARAVAAEAAARGSAETTAMPPLTPVAPPVAAVGRGRARAVNLSSWRVRSGAALCAMLLVGLFAWRFDESGRLRGDVQVALAELRLAEPAHAPPPQDLPLPAAAAASYPYAAPPPVVVDPVAVASNRGTTTAKQASRDKDITIAQLDQPVAEYKRAAPSLEERADARRAAADAPAAAFAPAPAAAPPAPVVLASADKAAAAPESQEPTLVTVTGTAVPPQIVTAPPHPPSVLPRRVMLIPMPAPAPAPTPAPALAAAGSDANADAAARPPRTGNTTVAAADAAPQKVEIAGARTLSSSPAGESLKKMAPASLGSLLGGRAPAPPLPLHSAADRGDIEALKTLLANASTSVDAPDATGRTALLHAVLAQQAGAVRLLLAAGADPARADPTGLTPRAAAQSGASAEIAALLGAPR